MPELPEVESVRRALEPLILGRRVEAVRLHRRDIVAGPANDRSLLAGGTITELRRRGKQLAIVAHDARAIVVHLGMTGQLIALSPNESLPRANHVHVEWLMAAGHSDAVGAGARGSERAPPLRTTSGDKQPPTERLLFRDPRRFGGVRTFSNMHDAEAMWARELGPDALAITREQLHGALRASRRAIKARLLDQAVLAGVGNIYADESLFAAGIRPRRASCSLSRAEIERLAEAIRATLASAIAAGGSTLRDFISPTGIVGSYQDSHLVYARSGEPCTRCCKPLRSALVAQRTTVWCSGCQK